MKYTFCMNQLIQNKKKEHIKLRKIYIVEEELKNS